MDKKRLWMLGLMVAFVSMMAVGPVVALAEPPQCNNGVDDDGDGVTDFPDDPHCQNPEDNTEAPSGHASLPTLTIRYFRDAAAFKGEVQEARNECREQRRVVLRRRTPEGTRTVARTFTDEQDRWKVYWPAARGRYFAVSLRVEVAQPDGTTLVCARDRSVTIRVRA